MAYFCPIKILNFLKGVVFFIGIWFIENLEKQWFIQSFKHLPIFTERAFSCIICALGNQWIRVLDENGDS